MIPAIPEKVKNRALQEGDEVRGELNIGVISDLIWGRVSPGGREEQEGLMKYVRLWNRRYHQNTQSTMFTDASYAGTPRRPCLFSQGEPGK